MTTKLTGPVRVRFPPSPTGFLHVGGARTAIYNDLLRHSLGGSLILRIEDTDQKRSDEAMTRQIVSALDWIGIHCDEGPFLQSERVEEHRAAALRLLEEGKAYHCFHSQEEVEAKRKEMVSAGQNYSYRAAFDEPSPEELKRRLGAGEPYAIRFRMPREEMVFPDLVRREVTFPVASLDDFIILRSDGSPTYHLSVVCDDIHNRVSHVLRGEDHISNTPKHIGLFAALGAPVPTFGHLPMILGPNKKRLSKRTGASSVEEFRAQGILPQALYNYLALLGWSPGDDREVMSRQEITEAFTVERLLGSAAVFDYDKLSWMNAQYMSHEPLEQILEHARPFLEEQGLADADAQRLHPVVDLYRQRAHNVKDLADYIVPFFRASLEYDPALCQKFLKTAGIPELLEGLAESYGALEIFDIESAERVLRDLVQEREIKAGALIHPTRMALTAAKAGPPLFDVVVVMGQEATVRHLRQFAGFMRQLAAESEVANPS